jgi:hypothetical protein
MNKDDDALNAVRDIIVELLPRATPTVRALMAAKVNECMEYVSGRLNDLQQREAAKAEKVPANES